MIGAVPDNYTWVTRLLGCVATSNRACRKFGWLYRKTPFFQTEARLIDLLIRAYVLKFTIADSANIKAMVQGNPDNPAAAFFRHFRVDERCPERGSPRVPEQPAHRHGLSPHSNFRRLESGYFTPESGLSNKPLRCIRLF
jgi:rubredoxin